MAKAQALYRRKRRLFGRLRTVGADGISAFKGQKHSSGKYNNAKITNASKR